MLCSAVVLRCEFRVLTVLPSFCSTAFVPHQLITSAPLNVPQRLWSKYTETTLVGDALSRNKAPVVFPPPSFLWLSVICKQGPTVGLKRLNQPLLLVFSFLKTVVSFTDPAWPTYPSLIHQSRHCPAKRPSSLLSSSFSSPFSLKSQHYVMTRLPFTEQALHAWPQSQWLSGTLLLFSFGFLQICSAFGRVIIIILSSTNVKLTHTYVLFLDWCHVFKIYSLWS